MENKLHCKRLYFDLFDQVDGFYDAFSLPNEVNDISGLKDEFRLRARDDRFSSSYGNDGGARSGTDL